MTIKIFQNIQVHYLKSDAECVLLFMKLFNSLKLAYLCFNSNPPPSDFLIMYDSQNFRSKTMPSFVFFMFVHYECQHQQFILLEISQNIVIFFDTCLEIFLWIINIHFLFYLLIILLQCWFYASGEIDGNFYFFIISIIDSR